VSIQDSSLDENDAYFHEGKRDSPQKSLAPCSSECAEEITRCIKDQINQIWERYDTRKVGYLTKDATKLFFTETLLILY